MIKIFKSLVCVITTISLALIAFVTTFAEVSETPVRPDVFVDFTTQDGFNKWEMLAKEYDEKDLVNGEYTVHGMKGQVWGNFVNDEKDGGFSRFYPLEPLDKDGKDKDGNTPEGNGDFRMTIELDVPITGDNQILAFCYRITKDALFSTNNIYMRDAVLRPNFEKTKDQLGGSGEFNGNMGFWKPAGLNCSGEWEIRVLNIKDFRVEENLKGIRIPIAARENEFFDLKWLCVFDQIEGKTLKEMKKIPLDFDAEEYKASQTGGADPQSTEIPAESNVPSETDVPKAEKKGCGGIIESAGFVMIMGFSAICLRKKKMS